MTQQQLDNLKELLAKALEHSPRGLPQSVNQILAALPALIVGYEASQRFKQIRPLRAGARTNLLMEFFARGDAGEKVVYTTPKGDFVSPAITRQLRKEAQAGRELAKTIKGWQFARCIKINEDGSRLVETLVEPNNWRREALARYREQTKND